MTAQQLKNSILQIAVQGKLVPQDPNDEPARVLLERIRAEKERLIKEGVIKREKNPSVIFRGADNLPYEKVGDAEPVCIADEVPFEIPETWEWVRFSSVIELQSGQDMTPDKYNANGVGIPYITGASNIENGQVIINRWTEFGKAFAYCGDILLTCKGTVGTMAILDREKVHIARQIMAVRPNSQICTDYIQLVLETLVTRFKVAAKSMIPGIAREDVLHSLLPLPPFAEQERIVQKKRELAPIIALYGERQNMLEELTSAFPDRLKKSILQTAVQGKLVPQDPNDEPAKALLERIRLEKQRLIKEGKLKKGKHESVVFRRDNSHYEIVDGVERCIDDEIPFEIPETWCFCRLGSILRKLTDGTHSRPKYVKMGIPFVSVKDLSGGKLLLSDCKYITEDEHRELYNRCNPEYGDILLTKVGTTGIPVIVNTKEKFSLFVSVALLKFNQKLVYNEYLVHLINSPFVQKQVEENTRGVGNKNWVMRDIASTLIAIPPLMEQHRIVDELNRIFLTCSKL